MSCGSRRGAQLLARHEVLLGHRAAHLLPTRLLLLHHVLQLGVGGRSTDDHLAPIVLIHLNLNLLLHLVLLQVHNRDSARQGLLVACAAQRGRLLRLDELLRIALLQVVIVVIVGVDPGGVVESALLSAAFAIIGEKFGGAGRQRQRLRSASTVEVARRLAGRVLLLLVVQFVGVERGLIVLHARLWLVLLQELLLVHIGLLMLLRGG